MNRILAFAWIILGILNVGVSQTYPCDFDIELEDIETDLKVNIVYPDNLANGDQFCAEFIVTNFEYVIGTDFQVLYDPSVISLDCDVNGGANINTGNCVEGMVFNCLNGEVIVNWFNNDVEGVCCNDGSTLFELCFTVTGQPLDEIFFDINIDEVSWGLDFSTIDYITLDSFCINTTITEVDCPDLTILAGFCYPSSATNNDGSLHFTVCGGVGPYEYVVTLVGPGDIVADGTNLNAGDEIPVGNLELFGQYLITVTDGNGDTSTRSIFFDQEGNQIDIDIEGISPSCFNQENGKVRITNISGGEPAFNFSWSNNYFGIDSIEGLGTGMYSVTVEDRNGCSDVASVLLEVDTLKLNYTVIDSASCMGVDNATILLTAEGGYPYTTLGSDFYVFQQWNNPPSSGRTLTGEEGGDMVFIQVTDERGCNVSETIEIPYKEGFEILEIVNTGLNCYGDRVAIIELFATEASSITAVLQDEDGANITDPSIGNFIIGGNTVRLENIPAGTYYVEVEIAAPAAFDGCTKIYELIITEPDELVFQDDGFTPPDCGGNPGSIRYTLFGGGGNFDVSLNGGPIPSAQYVDLGNDMYEIINVDGGMYELTVIDDNDCRDTLTYILPPAGTLPLQINIASTLECGGMDVGALVVMVLDNSCDNGNCDYEWFDENGNFINGGTQAIDLGQGCYTAVVTDNTQMCTNMITACLTQEDGIEFTEILTSPRCAGGEDGSIGITITQGEPMINYEWEDFPLVTGSVLAPISAGTYCLTITDANMCIIETCIDLVDPDSLTMEIIDIIPSDCSGSATGEINVTASNGFNGTDFYSYIVYDENGDEYTTASGTGTVNITGLEAGSYSVLVTDGQCSALEQVTFVITSPSSITIDLDNSIVIEPSCYGFCDGQISLMAIGGSGSGYSFSWAANGQVSPNLSGLCGDIFHYVDITDSDGCINRDSIFLNQPDTLTTEYNAMASQNLRCSGDSDATILLSTYGGTPNYDYQWTNNLSTTESAMNLSMGTYNVTVTDVNGCQAFLSHTITSPDPVVANFAIPEEPECYGMQTCITVNSASGGSGSGYTFSVDNTPPIPLDSCLSVIPDQYLITVFDDDGCAVDTTITINQPDQILVDLGEEFLEVSLGDSSAIIQASISAANPVTIVWNPMEDLECVDPECQIVNVFPTQTQLIQVTVTDINGCEATDEIRVSIGENRNVYVPNVFSPNGDGYNDEFSVYVGEGVRAVKYFGIFDRWGNMMYQKENIALEQASSIKWDGKFKGKDVVPGIYVYRTLVSFIDDQDKPYKGTFTLLK